MAFDRLTVDGLESELRALRGRVSELADSVASKTAQSAQAGRDVAYGTGRHIAHYGGEAGDIARRHPAATGLTLLAVAGAILCFTLLSERQTRGRRRR